MRRAIRSLLLGLAWASIWPASLVLVAQVARLGPWPRNLGILASTALHGLAIGAFVPLIPYLFAGGSAAVVAAIVFAGVGLFAIGALITLLTGRSALFSATRQLVFGLIASGVTFGLGRLIGTVVGG